MERASFKCEHTTTILRSRYTIGVWMGLDRDGLLDALAKVPLGATVVDIDEPPEGGLDITFELEKSAD